MVILTSLYGKHDQLQRQTPQDVDARWICFTDDPDLEAPEPWELVLEAPRYEHPCMAAKVRKFCPGFPRAIWIDANMEVTSPSFAREALDSVRDGLALFGHPRRDCIYAEASASLGAEGQGGKYAALPIAEQMDAYRHMGFPERAGLYACGTIAWSSPSLALGQQWLTECERWGFQDQLSFPVICRALGIRPGVFPFPQIEKRRPMLSNRWLRIHPHLSA